MGDQQGDKQEERPVRSSGYDPCDRCSRATGHDGYALPTTTVYDGDGTFRMVLCAQCLRDALANLQTEQARKVRPTLIPSLPPSPLPERTNPGVGVLAPSPPVMTLCSHCGVEVDWHRSVQAAIYPEYTRTFCTWACYDEAARR
jgi:hypothetical protein